MTTTESVTVCPMCRHAGDDGRPHELQTIDNLWRCGRCDWMFKVNSNGSTRHWLDPWTAGRRKRVKRGKMRGTGGGHFGP